MSKSDYPLFTGDVVSKLHLRVYEIGQVDTCAADVAAVSCALADAGHSVSVAVSQPEMVLDAVGRGWRDPLVQANNIDSLLMLTAALYELWGHGVTQPAVVVEDISTFVDVGRGGPDGNMLCSWVRAACSGDAASMFALTGLSYPVYVTEVDLPSPRPTTCVLGYRQHRSTSGPAAFDVTPLKVAADTVVSVALGPSVPLVPRDGATYVQATARALRSGDDTGPETVVERRLDSGPMMWAAPAAAAVN